MTKRAIVRSVRDGVENGSIEGDSKSLVLSTLNLVIKNMQNQNQDYEESK